MSLALGRFLPAALRFVSRVSGRTVLSKMRAKSPGDVMRGIVTINVLFSGPARSGCGTASQGRLEGRRPVLEGWLPEVAGPVTGPGAGPESGPS